jgi:hypothetical protein
VPTTQLKAREDEVIGLTSVHTTVSAQYERRTGELEVRCSKQAETIKLLETRRALDNEGFQVGGEVCGAAEGNAGRCGWQGMCF